jgi:LPXTG-motif cell wall-anchored protein
MTRLSKLVLAGASCALALLAGLASAQESKMTMEARKFEIISVDGNKVVARTDRGIREVTLPADFKVNVDGKDVGVADLKPGMKGTAMVATTTTSTPVTVTEVRNADVMAVAGNSVIVKGQNGLKKYTLDDVNDKNITIMKDGKNVNISDLRVGDKLTATIITRHPPKVSSTTEIKSASASAPAAPAAAPHAAAAAPAPAPAAAAAAAPAPAHEHAKKLPKTASNLPVVALLGALSLAIGASLTLRRVRTAR